MHIKSTKNASIHTDHIDTATDKMFTLNYFTAKIFGIAESKFTISLLADLLDSSAVAVR